MHRALGHGGVSCPLAQAEMAPWCVPGPRRRVAEQELVRLCDEVLGKVSS